MIAKKQNLPAALPQIRQFTANAALQPTPWMEMGKQNQVIELGGIRTWQPHLLNTIESIDRTKAIAISTGLNGANHSLPRRLTAVQTQPQIPFQNAAKPHQIGSLVK